MNPTTIYGRDGEAEQLRQLLSRYRSFLFHGSSGVGKTLLKRFGSEMPEMLYCRESSSSQTVFRSLAVELLAKNNRSVVKACGRGGLKAVIGKSAVSLRGIVTEALRENTYWIVLDHVQSPSQPFAATLKDVCARTGVPAVAVCRSEHMDDRMTVGRRPDSDVFLDDVTVSRDHAVVVKRGEHYYLDDCGSLNGTYVNRGGSSHSGSTTAMSCRSANTSSRFWGTDGNRRRNELPLDLPEPAPATTAGRARRRSRSAPSARRSSSSSRTSRSPRSAIWRTRSC